MSKIYSPPEKIIKKCINIKGRFQKKYQWNFQLRVHTGPKQKGWSKNALNHLKRILKSPCFFLPL